jgi:integrase
LADGSWIHQITLGRRADGKLSRKSFHGKTRTACVERRNEFLAGLPANDSTLREKVEVILPPGSEEAQNQPGTDVLFGPEFLRWLKLFKSPPTKKATTYSGYLDTYECHFAEFFGEKPLADITTDTVQEYYASKQMNGARRDGKPGGLSPKTIRNQHMLLKNFFDYAVKKYSLGENPTKMTDRPAVYVPQMRVLDPDEMRIFIREVLRETQRTAILFDLFTGLRVGELLAAAVDDVDVKHQELRIRRNISRVRTEAIDLLNTRITVLNYRPEKKTHLIIQDTPKTEEGDRIIPISDELFALLAKHLYFLEQSGWPNPHNLLFPSTKGTHIDPKSFEIRLAAVSKRCELLKVNPHALRHTFATRLVELGVPLTTIMELMGHASVSTTQKYVTTLVEEKRGAVEKISSLLTADSFNAEQRLNGAKRRMNYGDVRLPSWLQKEPETAKKSRV